MFPAADGQGNRPDDLDSFVIGRAGLPGLITDWHVYTIWSTSGTSRNLAEALTHHARDQGLTGNRFERTTAAVASAIPAMVSTRCAYLQDTYHWLPGTAV